MAPTRSAIAMQESVLHKLVILFGMSSQTILIVFFHRSVKFITLVNTIKMLVWGRIQQIQLENRLHILSNLQGLCRSEPVRRKSPIAPWYRSIIITAK